MLNVRRNAPTTARGMWCNLCGSRLVGKSLPLRFVRWALHGGGADPAHADGPKWSICVQCYRKRLQCAACGEQIGSQAFMLEGDSHFYCAQCFQRPRCDTCDRPTREWFTLHGRTLCERCRSTAVSDHVTAAALFRRVKAQLEGQLGMTLREPCQLRMVSQKRLLSMIDRSSLHNLDADSRGRCFGLFVRQGSRKAIYVEEGLPQIVMLEVLAHEYAHAWQSENCPQTTPIEALEGFAEWVAYKLLHDWGCYRRCDRMLRRDDLYGRGLKMVLGWERLGGQQEVLRRIKEY